MEGLTVHAAGLRTEVACDKLPAERAKAWIGLDTGLFKTLLQLLDDITDIVFLHHASGPIHQETSACPDTRFVCMWVGHRQEHRLQAAVQLLEINRKVPPLSKWRP